MKSNQVLNRAAIVLVPLVMVCLFCPPFLPQGSAAERSETGYLRLMQGPMVGAVSDRGFQIWARASGEYSVSVQWGTTFDLKLAQSGTAFQLRVWSELRRIAYGTTISYAELAKRIGKRKAFRAVGAANGRNSLPIVVPCHRVIASDGTLGGYGGGLVTKRALLALEGVQKVPTTS